MKPYLKLYKPDDPWFAHIRRVKAVEEHNVRIARLCAFLALAAWAALMGWLAVF